MIYGIMKKYGILLTVFIFAVFGCRKSRFNAGQAIPQQKIKYNLYDSVIREYNNGIFIQEFHYVINRNIEVNKLTATGEVLYNTDTFHIYDSSRLIYTNGSFPLIQFNDDSIVIYRHLGGVAYQTWGYLFGKEIN